MAEMDKPAIEFKEIRDEGTFNEIVDTQAAIYHTFKALQQVMEDHKALQENQDSRYALFVALLELLVEKQVISGDDMARRFPRVQARMDQVNAETSANEDDDSD